MTKLKDSALLDAFIGNLSMVFALPDTVLSKNEERMVELDMGCGKGSFTTELAKRHPERLILAADMLSGRLRKLVKRNQREGVENMRVLKAEARMLIARLLPDRSLDRIHILCPDPWPKGRHRGHRLLASDFTAQLHRVLKKDGIFHFSSDDKPYCDAVEKVMNESMLFAPVEPNGDLEGITSDFERRWLAEGKTVKHIYFKKLPLPPKTIGH